MARPLLNIDPSEVERLALIGTPLHEMAVLLGCGVTTLERRFGNLIEKARYELRKRLREKQIELALKGDRTILIWLGKNLLYLTDEQSVCHTGDVSIDLDSSALEAALVELTASRRIGTPADRS